MSELLWGKLGKYLASIAAFLLVEVAIFGWGDHHGRELIQARWDAQAAVMAKALAEAQEKAATISERVVTKYVDRVQVVQAQAKTITKNIPVYIHAKDDLACPVPDGFGRLLDAASQGSELSTSPGSTSVAPINPSNASSR